jgi:pimeloyl-ACP methyl ester carboxylesterase
VVSADASARTHLTRIFVDYFAMHGAERHQLLPLTPPAAARLGEVRVPALYIIGEHDDAQNQARGQLFASGIPGARKAVMAGCDHAPLLTQPESFGRIVVEFLREHPASEP